MTINLTVEQPAGWLCANAAGFTYYRKHKPKHGDAVALYPYSDITAIADKFAAKLALELECVLADRAGYYDKAMEILCEYRAAMDTVDTNCPTLFGEPVITPKDR